ncbi:Tfpi protein, partial [Operophtera brumata]
MLKPGPGPCRGSITMYFFKPETLKCETFLWGGCQGNGNRFDTEEECTSTCLSRPDTKYGTTTTCGRSVSTTFTQDVEETKTTSIVRN